MSIYTIIGIVAVLMFVGWLLFTNSQKPKRPSFTEGKSKLPLFDVSTMLQNITEKEKPEIVQEPVAELNEQNTEEDKIKDKKKDSRHDKNKKNAQKNTKFDLKSAVIGSSIIERKES